jgi:transposase
MKEINESVGIDVSKETLDARLHVKQLSAKFSNNKTGHKQLVSWVKSHTRDLDVVIFCFEHTGIYSLPLATFLAQLNLTFAMVPALQIKRSMGMVRGKNDAVDAQRIAEYSYLRRHTIQKTILPSKTLIQIKALLSLRERMVAQRAGYTASLREMQLAFNAKEHPELFKPQAELVSKLTKNIKTLDTKIQQLVKADPEIKALYELIVSVKGIGPIVATNLIVTTNCFMNFQNSRQLACYCGIAPFEMQSGTSLKGKSRVSHYANKKMKVLLNLAANNVVQTDPELRHYYERRLEQGKSKMSTLNIVRNKLLHRVFAVIKRGTPFVEIQKWAA